MRLGRLPRTDNACRDVPNSFPILLSLFSLLWRPRGPEFPSSFSLFSRDTSLLRLRTCEIQRLREQLHSPVSYFFVLPFFPPPCSNRSLRNHSRHSGLSRISNKLCRVLDLSLSFPLPFFFVETSSAAERSEILVFSPGALGGGDRQPFLRSLSFFPSGTLPLSKFAAGIFPKKSSRSLGPFFLASCLPFPFFPLRPPGHQPPHICWNTVAHQRCELRSESWKQIRVRPFTRSAFFFLLLR